MFNGSLHTVTVSGYVGDEFVAISGAEFLDRVKYAQGAGAFLEAADARGALWDALDNGLTEERAQAAVSLLADAEAVAA